MLRLQQVQRRTIVFISHDLDEAMRIGDRIAIMKDGEISARIDAPPGAKPQQVDILRHMV